MHPKPTFLGTNMSSTPLAKHRHYSDQEKRTLVQSVLSVIHIIEKKQNDTLTLAQKHEAWSEIVARYNAEPCCNYRRDTRQLKKLWDNIKTRSKRMVADQRLQRSMQNELSSTSSTEQGGFADLDSLADDSIAEKVIYYMSKTQQHHQLSAVPFDEDDDGEDDECYVESDRDYGSLVQAKDELPLHEEPMSSNHGNPNSCDSTRREPDSFPNPVSKRFAAESGTISTHQLPVISQIGSLHIPSEFMGNPMSLSIGAQLGSRPEMPNSSQAGRSTDSSLQRDRGQTIPQLTSPITLTTTSTATPVGRGGWVESPSVNAGANRRTPGVSRGNKRTLERLQKEECKLRIRKLRLEIKYARLEHEERLRVMMTQTEVLNSLKPNPSSIISSLFK